MTTSLLLFAAPNTPMGNPRRVYAAFEGNRIVGSWNVGYNGYNALPEELRDSAAGSFTVYVNVAEYKKILKAS